MPDDNKKIEKLATLSDEFMVAAGLPMGHTPLAEKIIESMTEEEDNFVGTCFFGALGSELSGDDAGSSRYTIALAEMFAAVAIRSALEDEMAKNIPSDFVDNNTAQELEDFNAPSLAQLVRKLQV